MSVTLQRGEVRGHSAPMRKSLAFAFARMIQANKHFADVMVEPFDNPRCPEKCFRVTWAPASDAARTRFLSRQQATQAARGEATWWNYVVFSTDRVGCYDVENQESGETYEVHLHPDPRNACSCPHARTRMAAAGLYCKHRSVCLKHLELGLVQEPSVIGRRAA